MRNISKVGESKEQCDASLLLRYVKIIKVYFKLLEIKSFHWVVAWIELKVSVKILLTITLKKIPAQAIAYVVKAVPFVVSSGIIVDCYHLLCRVYNFF